MTKERRGGESWVRLAEAAYLPAYDPTVENCHQYGQQKAGYPCREERAGFQCREEGLQGVQVEIAHAPDKSGGKQPYGQA